MFDLKRPCAECPFRRSRAAAYGLRPQRLEDIRTAPAFQCHKTLGSIQMSEDAGSVQRHSGDRPQQCAGLMAVLHASGQPNQIMQVAQRMGVFDAAVIDPTDTFDDWAAIEIAHAAGEMDRM